MIKGKLEATREIAPRFAIVGESKFARQNDEWILASNPKAKIEVGSLEEAFFDLSEKQTTNNSKSPASENK